VNTIINKHNKRGGHSGLDVMTICEGSRMQRSVCASKLRCTYIF